VTANRIQDKICLTVKVYTQIV